MNSDNSGSVNITSGKQGDVLFASLSGKAVEKAIEQCESCIYQFYEGSNLASTKGIIYKIEY